MFKIELITNYFSPEMGAAASRIFNLAKGLKELGHDVEVIAPLPNYPEKRIYEGYRKKFSVFENIEGIKVRRYWILPDFMPHSIFRILGMISFPFTLWWSFFFLWKRKPDIVIIQNTPLLVSFSAMILSKLLPGCKKVLNVSDLWPFSAAELGLMKKDEKRYKIMERIEAFNYESADLIVGQSNEIIQYIKEKVNQDKPFFLYRNISPVFGHQKPNTKNYHYGQPKVIYAGLLSSVQGVYDICREIDFAEIEVEFHIYGSGEEEQDIRQYIAKHPRSNIYFQGRVSKDELQRILPEYHASIVPLSKRIYGAVPSKIYELISHQVPVLFCGSGEGAEIIEMNNLGYTSDPEDYRALEKNILRLKNLTQEKYQTLIQNCRRFADQQLDFELQLKRLIIELKC